MAKQNQKNKPQSQAQPQSRAQAVAGDKVDDLSKNERSVLNSTNATLEEAQTNAPLNERGGEGDQNVSTNADELSEANETALKTSTDKDVPRHWQHAGVTKPRNAKIIGQDEEVTIEGKTVGNMVVVEQDIYREVFPRNSLRPTYVLVYTAGTAIPVGTLKERRQEAPATEDTDENDE